MMYAILGIMTLYIFYVHVKLNKLYKTLNIKFEEEEEPLDSTPVSSFYKSHREGK